MTGIKTFLYSCRTRTHNTVKPFSFALEKPLSAAPLLSQRARQSAPIQLRRGMSRPRQTT